MGAGGAVSHHPGERSKIIRQRGQRLLRGKGTKGVPARKSKSHTEVNARGIRGVSAQNQ